MGGGSFQSLLRDPSLAPVPELWKAPPVQRIWRPTPHLASYPELPRDLGPPFSPPGLSLPVTHSQPPETTMEVGGRRPARCNSCDHDRDCDCDCDCLFNLSLDSWALGAVRIFSPQQSNPTVAFLGANRHVTKLRLMPRFILTPHNGTIHGVA